MLISYLSKSFNLETTRFWTSGQYLLNDHFSLARFNHLSLSLSHFTVQD